MRESNIFEKVDLTIPKAKLEISKAIVKNIEESDLSVRQLAKNIGLQHHQIIRITGGENYTIETLLKVLQGLNLEIVIQPKQLQIEPTKKD